MPDPQWMKVSEAAHFLSVSERTIRRWMDEGRLPVDDAGKVKLVDVSGERQAGQAQGPASGQATPDTDRHDSEAAELRLQVKMLGERAERAEQQAEHWRLQAEAALMNQRLLLEDGRRRGFRWPWQRGGEE